jgi:anti-anti-sigma regulatory factor
MSNHVELPDDTPYVVEHLDERRAVVRFAEYVDHRRTRDLEAKLEEVVRAHQRVACDVSACETIDSDWLTLIFDLSVEARQSGKRLALVGLSEVLKKSADILGLAALEQVATIEEVWK